MITGAGGMVERIVEFADANETERAVDLCNAGVLCAGAADMTRWLQAVRNDNAKGEYYLTDVVALARADGRPVRGRRSAGGRSLPASTPAPNWPRRRPCCRPGCAMRRWRPA